MLFMLLLFVILAVAVFMSPKRTSPSQTLATSDKGDVQLEKFDNSRSNLSFQNVITLPNNLLHHPSNFQSRHSILKSRNNISRDHSLDSQSSSSNVGNFGHNGVGMGGATIGDIGVGIDADSKYTPVDTNYCGCSGYYGATK